jgi:hypothetical protein
MNFQFSILIFAISLVIVGTLILRYSVKASIQSQKWPPFIANCPDYWIDTTGDGSACTGSNMNVSPAVGCFGTVNFNTMNTCQKYNHSNTCGIYWDGINYGNTSLNSKVC